MREQKGHNEKGMTAEAIVKELEAFIGTAVEAAGSTAPVKPQHRIPFHWPPHPVSLDYHVLPSDWTGRASFSAHGEHFDVVVARTPFGVFGRNEKLWNEAKGESEDEMLRELAAATEPLFSRQFAIGRTLGHDSRFAGLIRDLGPSDLVKLLYCEDRDVASEARTEIEKQASSGIFTRALIEILRDARHPHRRIAQWCVLDMFEDLPAFARTEEDHRDAVEAIQGLLWSAPDDYARTVYKAGVVLGGHVCTEPAAQALIKCISAPSKFGRRSAMHAIFHLVEWMPQKRAEVVEALRRQLPLETEPELKVFAEGMAHDIEIEASDHVTEPLFPEEMNP